MDCTGLRQLLENNLPFWHIVITLMGDLTIVFLVSQECIYYLLVAIENVHEHCRQSVILVE